MQLHFNGSLGVPWRISSNLILNFFEQRGVCEWRRMLPGMSCELSPILFVIRTVRRCRRHSVLVTLDKDYCDSCKVHRCEVDA